MHHLNAVWDRQLSPQFLHVSALPNWKPAVGSHLDTSTRNPRSISTVPGHPRHCIPYPQVAPRCVDLRLSPRGRGASITPFSISPGNEKMIIVRTEGEITDQSEFRKTRCLPVFCGTPAVQVRM